MEHTDRTSSHAKRTLLYYFDMLADRTGKPLDPDCRTEIQEIVDDIIDAAVLAASKRLTP